MRTRVHPWKSATRQAGGIIAASVVAAVAFNLTPPVKVPWIRELPKMDTASYNDLVAPSPAVDTAQAPAPAAVDTAHAGVTDTVQTVPKDTLVASKSPTSDTAAPVKNGAGASGVTSPAAPSSPSAAKGVGTDVALQLFKGKKALFIDARPAEQFAQGHIPGAINIYAEGFEPHIPELLQYPMDTLIVAYCGGGLCELSHDLANQLLKLGFKRVVVYTGGTTEWTERKLPFTGGE